MISLSALGAIDVLLRMMVLGQWLLLAGLLLREPASVVRHLLLAVGISLAGLVTGITTGNNSVVVEVIAHLPLANPTNAFLYFSKRRLGVESDSAISSAVFNSYTLVS